MARWPSKDPNEILDYELDWSRRLDDGDTIASAEFSLVAPAGLTIASQSFTETTAKVWLTSGTLGETAAILCRVETTGARVMDWSMSLEIQAR
jgi:hypothetical protein